MDKFVICNIYINGLLIKQLKLPIECEQELFNEVDKIRRQEKINISVKKIGCKE